MPPRKKNQDKTKEVAQPTSAPPPEVDEIEDDVANIEQKIQDFNLSSSVAAETLKSAVDQAMAKIIDKHIKTYTDDYAASSTIASMEDAISALFPVYPKPLTPRELTPTPEPVRPDSWQEVCLEADSEVFQHSIVEEADSLLLVQGKMQRKNKMNMNSLPSWLSTGKQLNGAKSSSALAEATAKEYLESQNSKPPPEPKKSPLKPKSPPKHKNAFKPPSLKENFSLESIPKISVMNPRESEVIAMKEKNSQVNSTRLRQFRRRSAQQKKGHGTSNSTPSSIPSRKAPLPPGSNQGGIRLPSVQIVDPKLEALDYRRKQLKIGKIRPKTDSEYKFMNGSMRQHNEKKAGDSHRGPAARKMTLVKNSKIKLPEINKDGVSGIDLRNLNLEQSDVSASTFLNGSIGKLPETLVDSLAITEGSNNLIDIKLEDFDSLPVVEVGI